MPLKESTLDPKAAQMPVARFTRPTALPTALLAVEVYKTLHGQVSKSGGGRYASAMDRAGVFPSTNAFAALLHR